MKIKSYIFFSLTFSLLSISPSLFAKKGEKKEENKNATKKDPSVMFSSLPNCKHIHGEEITPESLQGKVIFFEYWGINCPPCLASFPHLVRLQSSYGKTGKFTVLASHVGAGYSEKVKEFCASKGVKFPVYQQLRDPLVPSVGGIPYALLIDHTGKVVAKGSPGVVAKKVAEYVRNAPPEGCMIPLLELTHWATLQKKAILGSPIKKVLDTLQKSVDKQDKKSDEAGLIITTINAYLNKMKPILIARAKKEPTKVMEEMKLFVKSIEKMDDMQDIATLYLALKKDQELTKLISLKKKYKSDIEKGKKMTDSVMKSYNEKANKIISTTVNEGVSEEATLFLTTLQK